jgi:hypothetical protein
VLGERSHEVPKLGIRDTWQNHKVGLCDRQADTHRLVEGVGIPLTYCVSVNHEVRAWELNV